MCGVIGTVNLRLDEASLHTLEHRGPDGLGIERIVCGDQTLYLGHTRLAILDLSYAGHQPMQSQDGRWWITFNGEIYNHLELRRRLSGPFLGHSDTETLVELIALQGMEATLPLLNGVFAFAALDTKESKIWLARDPYGVKPLYYFQHHKQFAFASEVRSLRALNLTSTLDEEALRQFLTLRYTPSTSTLWKSVHRIPPGHSLCLDLKSGGLDMSGFIKPTCERFQGSMDDAIHEYRTILSSAVKRQLLSDVPVGVLLSGGVDSALVAAMAKEAGSDLPCFTVGFGAEHQECEIDDAAATARVLGLPFQQVVVTQEQLRESLPEIVRAVEEPLGTTSVMPMWHLVRRARQNVTVVLTGQGSDEPWGGYFRYQVELLRNHMPWPALWRTGQSIATLWPGMPDTLTRGFRTLAEREPVNQIMEACALFSASERRLLLGDAGDGGVKMHIDYWLDWLSDVQGLSGAERMMRLDSRMNLADDLLLYGDKISMAFSLEARVPMLDVELVRFIESLPIEYRIRWREGKVAHKKMAERYLPPEIVHRQKKGFQVPFGAWSRGAWRTWVEELLLDGLDGFLLRPGVERLWKEHLSGRPDRSRQIFALLMLALWRREHAL